VKLTTYLIITIAICYGAFGQFQLLDALPDMPGVTPAFTTGSWVQYRIDDEEGKSQKVKFSILSEEEIEGETFYWFEMKVTDENGDWSIFKIKSPDIRNKEEAVSLIIQKNGELPREMDFVLPANRPTSPGTVEEADSDVEETPEMDFKTETNVSVGVKAGKFESTRFSFVDDDEVKTDVWISDDVPIIGLVKATSDNGQVELIKYDTKGAKSEITGKVEAIEMPNLKELMKRGAR
jgi:hypothetical protein